MECYGQSQNHENKSQLIFVLVRQNQTMSENSICKHCKRPKDEHTRNESLACALEIAKSTEPDLTEDELTKYFNEIKSGEFSRMKENQNTSKET